MPRDEADEAGERWNDNDFSSQLGVRPIAWTLGVLLEGEGVKTTAYFEAMRTRPDRAMIQEKWIERARDVPFREHVQADGRIRRWAQIHEAGGRYLRVVLLPDGDTVHNAFFDRGFTP